MLNIIKNNWYRLMEEKLYFIYALVLTICAASAAIILTNHVQIKETIAIVNNTSQNVVDSSYYNITYLSEEPPMSEILENRYDAVVVMDQKYSYRINTIKSDEFKENLQRFLSYPSEFTESKEKRREVGTNIIGYMMMFVLMQGILYARLFAQDKEKHMIERVAFSPIYFTSYLLGHGIFMWALLVIPSVGVVIAAHLLGISVGFSIFQYIILFAILALLSTAFGLCVNASITGVDKANMAGNSIIILTTILAGSFYSFAKEDSLLNKALYIIPQKNFIEFVNAVEKGTLSSNTNKEISYVLFISILMLFIAVIKTRKDYVFNK